MAGYVGRGQPVAVEDNSVETADIIDGAVTDVKLNSAKLNAIADNANNYTHPAAHTISEVTGLQTSLDGKIDDAQVLTDVPIGAVFTDTETTTTLSIATNILSYVDELGATTNLDLSLYLDDTNLAYIASGALNGTTGIATFTRTDATTFTVDLSALLDDTSVTVNNTLISISTTEALSANQGKVLKGLADGLETRVALNDAKVSNVAHPLVQTAVPVGAVFTDTDTVYTHPTNHAISVTTGLQTALDSKLPLAGGTMTGTIAGFTSTGIDDNATSTAITIDASQNVTLASNVGIGTSSTFGKASINSNGAPATSGNMSTGLTVHNTSGGTAINIGTYDAGGYSYIQSAYVNSAGTTRDLAFLTGATERMRIDSAGRVTMPYQPAFYVYGTTGNTTPTSAATTAVPFSTASFNRGNHFNLSSNVFYAPVAGVYSFHYHTYEQGSNGYNRLTITLNASPAAYKITGSHAGALTTTISVLIYCNVNDAIGVTFQSDNLNPYYAAYNHSFFTGHLLG